MKDYYFILGVSNTAAPGEIKEAFRKLCLKYHPDRTVLNSYTEERYMEICEAYKVLSNGARRLLYDKKLARHQLKLANTTLSAATIKDGLFPELKTSYKGHYPWFAIFSIIIVCGLAMIFLYARRNDHKPETPQKTLFTPISVKQSNQLQKAETSLPDPEATKAYILSALKANTPKTIVETIDNNAGPSPELSYREQQYNYSFNGEKLIVTYNIGYKNLNIRKKVSIPYHDVETVYLYDQHLWICSDTESIKDINLSTGQTIRTSFFSVRFPDDVKTEAL